MNNKPPIFKKSKTTYSGESGGCGLPVPNNYFDVVVSAGFVHTVRKEFGCKSAAATVERMRVVGVVVKVLKSGGVGMVWDLLKRE